MSVTAGTVLTDVLSRIRDVNATMVSSVSPPTTADGQAFVYAMVSYAQMYISVAERQVTNEVTFTPTANKVLYQLSSIIPDCVTILSMRVPGVAELDGPCDWRGFARNSFTWLSDTDTAFLAWAQIGKDLMAIVPAFAAAPPAVKIRYLNTIPAVTASGNLMSVPDDTVEHVTRLAELVCRIKTRQLDGFEDRLKMLGETIGVDLQAEPEDGKSL